MSFTLYLVGKVKSYLTTPFLTATTYNPIRAYRRRRPVPRERTCTRSSTPVISFHTNQASTFHICPYSTSRSYQCPASHVYQCPASHVYQCQCLWERQSWEVQANSRGLNRDQRTRRRTRRRRRMLSWKWAAQKWGELVANVLCTSLLSQLFILYKTIRCRTIRNHIYCAGSHVIQIPTKKKEKEKKRYSTWGESLLNLNVASMNSRKWP